MIQLDYQTPEPHGRLKTTGPLLRFGTGVAVGMAIAFLVTLIIPIATNRRSDRDPCGGAICTVIYALISCGLLRLGLTIRQKFNASALLERHKIATIVNGVTVIVLIYGTAFISDRVLGPGRAGIVILPMCAVLPLACAWTVFVTGDDNNQPSSV